MIINNVISAKAITPLLNKKMVNVNFSGLQADKFEKSVTPNLTMESLINIKDYKGVSKFSNKKMLASIKQSLEKDPKKCEIAQNLAEQRNINQENLKNILSLPYDAAKDIQNIATLKDKKRNNLKFAFASDIKEISKMTPENIKRVVQLSETPLKASNIIKTVQDPKNFDCEELASKIGDLVNKMDKDHLDEVTFEKDDYARGEYTLTGFERVVYEDEDDEEGEADIKTVFVRKETFDSKLNHLATDVTKTYRSQKGNEYEIRKVNDLRNNTTAKTRYALTMGGKKRVVTNEVRIIKDANGKVQRTEYTEPSDVKGVYNIKHVMPNGEVKQVSMAKVDPKTGITTIKKDMTSPLGVRTQYLYEDDPQGNRIVDYKITDKNGKVLLNNSESFEIVNDNKFISSKNGHKYEMTMDEGGKGLVVKDLKNPKRVAKFSSDKNIIGKQDEILNVLKQMPGEQLFKLNQTTDELVGINNTLKSYSNDRNGVRKIVSGNDLFIILHELGHAYDEKDVAPNDDEKKRDFSKALFNDKQFNKIFDKEKRAFNKAYPDSQRNHVSYFLNSESHYLGTRGGKREAIAETNALLTTAKSHEILGIRSQYLQQNFPETIAYLNNKLVDQAPESETK